MLSAGKLSSDDVSTGEKLQAKSRPKLLKNCPRAAKSSLKICPKSQKTVHGQQNQVLKSRPKSQKTAAVELSTGNKTKF